MAIRKSGLKRAAPKKRPRKAKAGTRGLLPPETVLDLSDKAIEEAKSRIESEGGVVLGGYHDPLGNNPLLFAVLPIDKVEPTPFQRDVSDMHHKRLADVIHRTGLFLDPIIAITAPGKGFWTPNGGHRLAAMRRLGARSVTALLVPKREVAWQILALNTEKAHNLKDKSLEVIRIFRNLLEEDGRRPEKQFDFYFEEAAYITLGLCYEKNARFSGAAYRGIVRRLEGFSDSSLSDSLKTHKDHAEQLIDLDEKVAGVVAKLKAKGFVSPYLKSFVVARVNPLRFMQGEPPPLESVLKTMRERLAKFNVEKIRQEDIASSGGPPDDSD
ncbi:MAG TPA: ParB N-terminal domain-containing protein [Burkholderiales bacterium]|jgi:ParB family chromosome partitioning protein|nr:ParB N-terminal domain-containing protein [Burkholderiales bacterium]